MFKRIVLLIFIFILGAGLGIGTCVWFDLPSMFFVPAQTEKTPGQTELPVETASLLESAYNVVSLIHDGDYSGLSEMVHPEKGVIFVPYSYVDPDKNLSFTAAEVSGFATDTQSYVWGLTDGEGAPIDLTPAEYFSQYVYNADYLNAPVLGINHIVKTGNSMENVADAFSDSQFVEFHFPYIDQDAEGFDWCSLKLVFELYHEQYKLIAVIHSQWTI